MENKTQHTPGPWTVSLLRMGEDDFVRGFSIDAEGRHRAVTYNGTAQPSKVAVLDPSGPFADEPGFYTPSEMEANARLIAAAPDLLWALREVLDSFGALGNHSELCGMGITDEDQARIWGTLAAVEGRDEND